MKHNFLVLLLAGTVLSAGMTISSAALAAKEDMPPPAAEIRRGPNPEKMAQKMAEDLGLTKEQQEKARAIHEKGRAEIEPLMKEMQEIREKMDAKRRANMEEFESILTPEQKAKFEAFKKNPPHRRDPRGFGPKGERPRGEHRDMPHDKPLPPKE